MFSPATVAKKPGHRGEREISRKPSRREGRMFPVEPVVLPPCFFCTGPTGAIGTRLSLRPLIDWRGRNEHAKPRANHAARSRSCVLPPLPATNAKRLRKGAERRSNPLFLLCCAVDCFAEPVIGRAFARPVGSQ